MSDDGSKSASPPETNVPPVVPAMPDVLASSLSRGTPELIVEGGVRHSLGWQDHRSAGPGFVLARLRWAGSVKVRQRFPLTDEGWQDAWRALRAVDARSANVVEATLRAQAARRSAAADREALDAQSLYRLMRVKFNGGAGGSPLVKGRAYDVRFLRDQLTVFPASSVRAVLEIAYPAVQAAEVSGPSRAGRPGGEIAVIAVGLGLLGAVLGLLLFGLPGLLLAGALLVVVGVLLTGSAGGIESVIAIRTAESELYFVNDEKRPGELRIEMSEALQAIDLARRAQPATASDPGSPEQPPAPGPGSIPDELGKLASLLEQGLLTRDEFELLKAKLIAGS